MTRTSMLRAGYAGLGIAFLALAATLAVPALTVAGLGLAFLAGILLAFTDDHLPKWAGLVIIVYFVLSILAFLAVTPITINRGGENFFVNAAPPGLADNVIDWMGRLAPLLLCGAAIAAVWERERMPRILLLGALGGFVLHAVLYIVLTPSGDDVNAAIAAAQTQARLLTYLFALSAAVGAVGALWATTRPDSL